MSWPEPEKVPILSAKDICRGSNDGPNGTHCLRGWLVRVPGAEDAILRCIPKKYGGLISSFNDDTANSKAKIAAVWNRAMRKLGYTEPCDYP